MMGNITRKQAIGMLMLVAPFIAIFVAAASVLGVLATAGIYIGIAALVAFIWAGVSLASGIWK